MGMVLACWIMWEVRGAASAIMGLATTMAILFLPKIDWKPLVWVGTVSYSLYLLHVPIGGRVLNVLERFSHFELVKILAVPAALATSLLAAWLFFLFHLPRKFMQDSLDLVSLMFSDINFNASYSWITWLPINFAS